MRDGAVARIRPHARAVTDAWVAAGTTGAWLLGPAGEREALAGDADAAPTAELALDGALCGWTLVVAGGAAVDRARLAADASLLAALGQREHELAATAAALVDTSDQLLALYDLAASSATTLTSAELTEALAQDALRITRAGSVAIELASGGVVRAGGDAAATHLRSSNGDGRLVRAEAGRGGVDLVSRSLRNGGRVALASTAERRFTTPQLRLIDAVVDHVSGLLALASMHESTLADALIRRDAETAASLARLVLPTEPPRVRGLDVAGRCDPTRLAAGDFYTWIETPAGLVVAVGDVAGKGLGAALVMTMVMGAIARAAVSVRDADPGRILAEIDRELAAYLEDASVFVTLAVAVHRPGGDTIRVANAGHSPVIARIGGRCVPVRAGGPPVGVLTHPAYDVVELPFDAGDVLVIGTDGLVEQTDAEGRQHGDEPIVAAIESLTAASSAATVDELFARVERFAAGAEQIDDRTALVLRREAGT